MRPLWLHGKHDPRRVAFGFAVIVNKAQPFCDASMDDQALYSGWNGIKTLETKKWVHRDKRYEKRRRRRTISLWHRRTFFDIEKKGNPKNLFWG
jgi:hypothetical protein